MPEVPEISVEDAQSNMDEAGTTFIAVRDNLGNDISSQETLTPDDMVQEIKIIQDCIAGATEYTGRYVDAFNTMRNAAVARDQALIQVVSAMKIPGCKDPPIDVSGLDRSKTLTEMMKNFPADLTDKNDPRLKLMARSFRILTRMRMDYDPKAEPELDNAVKGMKNAGDTVADTSNNLSVGEILKRVVLGTATTVGLAVLGVAAYAVWAFFHTVGKCKVFNPSTSSDPMTIECPHTSKSALSSDCLCTSPTIGPCGNAMGTGCQALGAACSPPFAPSQKLCSAGYQYQYYTESPADRLANAIQKAIDAAVTVLEIIMKVLLYIAIAVGCVVVLWAFFKVCLKIYHLYLAKEGKET